jgi:hypothetical protein
VAEAPRIVTRMKDRSLRASERGGISKSVGKLRTAVGQTLQTWLTRKIDALCAN